MDNTEEGGDDVKSSCPLCLGLHTCYNGCYKVKRCLLYTSNSILRKILNRPRPFKELGIESLIEHEDKGSCPSNHAVSAMIIAMAWCSIFPVVGAVLIVLAIFTGLSRVMTGVHYPVDVFLGWLIAIVIGCLGFFVF